MTAAVYTFEGESLTVAEIQRRVPLLSHSTIRKHLAEGRNTRTAMLAYDPNAGRRAGGRNTSKRMNAK